MAEETEGLDTSAQASAAGVDPAALSLALGAAAQNDRVAAEAESYLKKQASLADEQIALTRLQAKELSHELKLRHWSLQLRHASAILKFMLEVSLALIGVAVACFIGAVVWGAAHDDGLIVEGFSVPPDLAARGLTGQVVATQMLDDLTNMQAQTVSSRAPGSYANDWGNDLKVEIPDTGVSIGEVNNYLHQSLGHQTRISGEVVRTATGIAVTARSGIEPGSRFSGPESDFDALLQRAAEAVYASTQPYRYGVYLLQHAKNAQANALFERNRQSGTRVEQAWENSGWFNTLSYSGRLSEAAEAAHAAVNADPDIAWGWTKVAGAEIWLGRAEAALASSRTALRLLSGSASTDLEPTATSFQQNYMTAEVDELLGDYSGATKQLVEQHGRVGSDGDVRKQVQGLMAGPGTNIQNGITRLDEQASDLIAAHDLKGVSQVPAETPEFAAVFAELASSRGDLRGQAVSDSAVQGLLYVKLLLAAAEGDWTQALQIAITMQSQQRAIEAAYLSAPHLYFPVVVGPLIAYADAMQGDFAAAHVEIDRTPADCDLCLRTRARIDDAEKNYDGAAFWFARAAQLAPSIPFAFNDWGQMLLAKGDPDGAIGKFILANQKGPHFADPLEMWGEALMKKNRSDLALAKFAEADKYAPNWGRLHLKWGEALYYAGKKDEAAKQFAQAAGLDLTQSEKADLAAMNHG